MSYAQNGEDVVLWRALSGVADGCYVDVGAHDPTELSVTRHLYEQGWRGLNVEPVPAHHEALLRERPGDVSVAVAAGDLDGTVSFFVVRDTGLSTMQADLAAGYYAAGRDVERIEVPVRPLSDLLDEHLPGRTLHALKVDVEGAERAVLAGLDLERHRPWVVLVEATEPLTATPSHQGWESLLLDHRYTFTMFDGLSRWYVADEHAARLGPALSYPAGPLDPYTPVRVVRLQEDVERQTRRADLWNEEALRHALVVRTAEQRAAVAENAQDEDRATLAEAVWRADLLAQESAWRHGLLEQERDWLREQLAAESARADAEQARADAEQARADRATAGSIVRVTHSAWGQRAQRAYRRITPGEQG